MKYVNEKHETVITARVSLLIVVISRALYTGDVKSSLCIQGGLIFFPQHLLGLGPRTTGTISIVVVPLVSVVIKHMLYSSKR